MSFLSKSSKSSHYKHGHQGSGHYKRMGIMEDLFDMMVSKSKSNKYYGGQHNGTNKEFTELKYITCSKCGARIPSESKFCLECGVKINQDYHCHGCGEKLPADANFCNNCGAKAK